MPSTQRPAACNAGTSAPKFEDTVENVPCSNTTGRASEVQSGSFTPARPTGRSPAMVVVIAEVVFAGASDDVRTVDKVGVVVCFADEHDAADSASTTVARITKSRRPPVRISRHASVPQRRAPPAATEMARLPTLAGTMGG